MELVTYRKVDQVSILIVWISKQILYNDKLHLYNTNCLNNAETIDIFNSEITAHTNDSFSFYNLAIKFFCFVKTVAFYTTELACITIQFYLEY